MKISVILLKLTKINFIHTLMAMLLPTNPIHFSIEIKNFQKNEGFWYFLSNNVIITKKEVFSMRFYFPILRHSNSEMNAFKLTWDSTKEKIFPIIEGKRISRKNTDSWDKSFNSAGRYLMERIGKTPFIYDFKNVFDNLENRSAEIKINNINPVDFLISKFDEYELNYIPCFNHDSPEWMINTILSKKTQSIAIRIRYYDIEQPLHAPINSYVEKMICTKFKDKKIYLILDFKNKIDEENIKLNLNYFSNYYEKILSISTLTSSVDTEDRMSFKKVSNRDEIKIYNKIKTEFPDILFSDYTTRLTPEPDLKEGFNMNNSYLKLYYTTIKGYYLGISDKFDLGEPENFQDVCNIIINSPLYSKKNYTVADEEIYRCAHKLEEVLTHQKTIEMSINHHLQFTVDELNKYYYFFPLKQNKQRV